jgi:hypothetical protein
MVQVYFLGSRCCAVSYSNTVVKKSRLREDLPDSTKVLYQHCFAENKQDFLPKNMINAEISISSPQHWKEDKGFPNFLSFANWIERGPISLIATKDIKIGQEIISDYPFTEEGTDKFYSDNSEDEGEQTTPRKQQQEDDEEEKTPQGKQQEVHEEDG